MAAEHGTSARYSGGCRCTDCRAAHAAYNRSVRDGSNPTTRELACWGCGVVLVLPVKRGSTRKLCEPCRAQHRRDNVKRHKEKRKAEGSRTALWAAHRMTPEDYEAMLLAQGGRCAACGNPESGKGKFLHVDHDHSCCGPRRSCADCRRGLLCIRCNMALGLALDSPEILRSLAEYAEKRKG